MSIPALLGWHEHHRACAAAAAGASIPAHALLETYSVMTRLPAPHRVSGDAADRLLGARFRSVDVLVAPSALQRSVVGRLAELGIEGGAAYDALVGLTADHHGETLITRDARAARTYDLLAISYDLMSD